MTGFDPDGHDLESDAIASAWGAEGRDAQGNYMASVGDEVDAEIRAGTVAIQMAGDERG